MPRIGFTARNDIFLDRIRDFGSYYRDSFDYDRHKKERDSSGSLSLNMSQGTVQGINTESITWMTPFD